MCWRACKGVCGIITGSRISPRWILQHRLCNGLHGPRLRALAILDRERGRLPPRSLGARLERSYVRMVAEMLAHYEA